AEGLPVSAGGFCRRILLPPLGRIPRAAHAPPRSAALHPAALDPAALDRARGILLQNPVESEWSNQLTTGIP
ncbi:hypothetical protein, partial [Streptomyces sp. NPDC001919]